MDDNDLSPAEIVQMKKPKVTLSRNSALNQSYQTNMAAPYLENSLEDLKLHNSITYDSPQPSSSKAYGRSKSQMKNIVKP